MKTEKNILIAFILNLAFSVFELFGGIFTGSIAIISDSIHDIGDAASIGAAFFLEKKSKKAPDEKYTYGYVRYSAVGGLITTLILLIGSVTVFCNSIGRIIAPVEISYNSMIIFAIIGTCVNLIAALVTRKGSSLNQKAVNLHMLEDVLGWIVVLIGAVVMKFTDIYLLDPLISIGVAIFIFINAIKSFIELIELFLDKTPRDVDISKLRAHLCEISGILDVHHIHVRSIDGQNHYATMHIVTDADPNNIKKQVREELEKHGIVHSTLELETSSEECDIKECHVEFSASSGHHHHH